MKTIYTWLIVVFLGNPTFAQTNSDPFNFVLEEVKISNVGGVQSYAFGQTSDGKWLILGGRLDGLHRRQPWASFDPSGNNNQIIVIDPVQKKKWSAPLTALSTSLQEQLSSTNMEFHQDGKYLYVVGGYGYNVATATKKTFENFTSIDVDALVYAVINGKSISPYFIQIVDSKFAVTGGHLKKIYDVFYLVGGNRFDGNYNPMGNNTYTQKYTNAIRKFTVENDGVNLRVKHLSELYDSSHLHRRDFNVVPQINPSGKQGLIAFSGVFQYTVDLPFLNCVQIDSSGYEVNNDFQQYYNHYHCATLPIYSDENQQMHSVFFGGISQYYDSAGVLVQDNNVPFVKTIARVTQETDGSLKEYKIPNEMPGFLGASSEFILNLNVPHFENEVIKLDELNNDTTLVGYIFGGISSSAPNVFFTNTGSESTASSQIFKVLLVKNNPASTHSLNHQSTSTLKLQVLPNPNRGEFLVRFNLAKPSPVKLTIYSINGSLIDSIFLTDLKPGQHQIKPTSEKLKLNGTYMLHLETQFEKATQKIIVDW